ncbi:MAG: nitroreductase, partial [candidate division NC10 bacterium]
MTKEHNSVEAVLAYHRRSKHHLSHYAASLGYLDWDTQPDPFRTFVGAERVELPLLADRLDAAYPDLYSPGAVPPMPMERNSVAMLFELALGLSAWKQYKGSRWALRCNPSSGNLHPTEGYAILPEMPGLYAGVYHYVSRDHTLERRC